MRHFAFIALLFPRLLLAQTVLTADGLTICGQSWLHEGGNAPYSCTTDQNLTNFIARANISGPVTNALCTLVSSLKSSNLWQYFDAIYPFAAGTPAGDTNNLVSAAYGITWTNCMTNAAYHGSWGVSNSYFGGNVSSHGTTTYIPATVGMTNQMVAIWAVSLNPGSETTFWLASDALTYSTRFEFYGNFSGSPHVNSLWDGVNEYNPAHYAGTLAFNTTNDVFCLIERFNVGNVLSLVSGLSTNVYQPTTTNLPNAALYFGDTFTNFVMGLAAIGHDLPTNQVQALYSIIQTYETSMGR